MPIKMWPPREAFETMGFKFGTQLDDLFFSATLPPGWTRKTASHDMYSDILDEQGRRRVEIFYKAAFYDRKADARLLMRYTIGAIYPGDPGSEGLIRDAQFVKDEVFITVLDAGQEIHRFPKVKSREQFDVGGPRIAAGAWIADRFPNYNDPLAYW